MEAAASVLRKIFSAVVFLCLAVSGCNTCYSGFWNGSGSGVTVNNTSCPLTKATGTVIVLMSVAPAPSTGSAAFASPLTAAEGVLHIFVTLRGIEARPRMMTDEASSGWQQLAPDLPAHPVQLDLLTLNGNSRLLAFSAGPNVRATVPADEYAQLRLRPVPLRPSSDDLIPENNACGNVGWNCVVFADHSVRPLEFDGAAPEIYIPLDRGANSFFRVLPDEIIYLSIEFDAASSVFFVSNTAVGLAPLFRVVSRSSSPAATAG
jgi:hypothetical protein